MACIRTQNWFSLLLFVQKAIAFFASSPYAYKFGEARADARFARNVYDPHRLFGLSEPRGIRAATPSTWRKYEDEIGERCCKNTQKSATGMRSRTNA